MRRALVAGALANKPCNGGEAWVRLSWILGLRRLGFDVHFVEEIAAGVCVDSAGRSAEVDASVNLAYFRDVTDDFGVDATLLCDGMPVTGLDRCALLEVARSADLLLNISGHLVDPRLLAAPRRRVFLDIDPGFTQAWHAAGDPGARLAGHDVYASIGERIGEPDCPIPLDGIDWLPTRQPVVLDEWGPPAAAPTRDLTTVARWRSAYGAVTIAGTTYGLKHHAFRRIAELPRLVDRTVEVALAIDPADAADRATLVDHGWRVVDPAAVAGTPRAFRDFVQSSAAEISACQGVYAGTRCGWISDRTVRYLASGRPAIVEDTAPRLPAGEGLLTFTTVREAAAAIEEVTRHYDAHAQAARDLAVRHLDSDRVIGEFLDRAGVGA